MAKNFFWWFKKNKQSAANEDGVGELNYKENKGVNNGGKKWIFF